MGGKAMPFSEFRSWREKGLLGVSFTAVVPTGQYDPARLANIGSHRWAFKPEVGLSRRWGSWVLDCYAGVWFFTQNDKFLPGSAVRTQQMTVAGETHLTYYVKPRLWASLDGNFWAGGRSTINGRESADEQRNSRVGATLAIPLNQHQSVKMSYARGAYIRNGGDYRTVSVAWQYSWLKKNE
jgi:hypothetical protein